MNQTGTQYNIKIKRGKYAGQVYQRVTPCFKGAQFLRGGSPSCDDPHMAMKVAVINVLTGGEGTCRWCGQGDIDVLTIDHITGNGNEHRRQLRCHNGSGFYRWLIKNDYPTGHQILCFNCNWKKRMVEWRAMKQREHSLH